MTIDPAGPRRLWNDWRVRFALLSTVWGFSFLLIKLGTESFSPLQVSLGRIAAGAGVLLVATAVRRDRLPRGLRVWIHLAVAGFLLNTLPFTLFGYAELRISSTLAGICNATTPLWGMLVGLVALSEDRPTRRRAAGLGVGFVGVLTVLGIWQGFAGQDLTGTVLALVASASYAVGWAYLRRTLPDTGHSNLSMAAAQLTAATAQLVLLVPFATDVPTAVSARAVAAVLVLGVLGTGVAFLMQYRLVIEVGPTVSQTVTYFIPLVAAVAGVTLLGEELAWSTPVGAVIVLVGAAMIQTGRRGPVVTTSATPATPGTR
ncbi:drug/metabolite transporter (DMT)-like permease [Stackebrandtia albiflava]|uniref:Drug/metabolite transporter (DMT)-like permease n=1 Tax=Stackebrandtia albiflava TaxID=406432 RepID=A0A562V2J0_9ACTN|nr:DMT family transporter [Stackebrandtia albiflava]TWJ12053.1 drug/metabolite transporter (DMT)-like permease [Stackebrandtia albiflava]